MILAPTWKAYFAARESNARGNKSPAAYLTAWSNTATPESKLNLLTNDPDTAILAGDSGQGIMFLHSFKNLGGTILSPSDKVACLLGGTRMAPILVVNEVTTFDDIEIVTPSANDIRACNSIEELFDLNAPLVEENPDTITFRGTNSFLPPPWLLDTVLNTRSDNPHELILAAKAGASLFDQQQLAIDPTYASTTDAILDEFVMWAWAVKKRLVPSTGYYLDANDEELEHYQNNRHQQCIMTLPPPMAGAPTGATAPAGIPPTFAAPPGPGHPGAIPTNIPTTPTTASDIILQQLAVGITRQSEETATQNELIARQLEHSLEKEDKKKDRLKKFHPSIKQLILFASAEDAEAVPHEILDSCKRVFNADNVTNAEQELTLQFGNMGMQDAHFAPSFVTALYSGKFLWSKNFTPSNFSPFMICESEPLTAPGNNQRKLTLHLEDTTGKTSDDIVSGSKLTVKAPTTFHEMFQQLKFFRGACIIFFGLNSVAATSLHALIQLVDQNKHIFKSQEVDTEFMSKFLFSIDKRYQLWLEGCMTLTTRTAVDDSILNFLPLVNTVCYGTFELRLPLTFAKEQDKAAPSAKPNKRPNGGGGGGGGGDPDDAPVGDGSARKKRKSVRVTNEHQPDQFKMRTGESWAANFANKGVQNRVPWGDVETIKMCPRWFIGGFCFDNCHHKSSHVKDTEIPPDKFTAFKSFLDGLRGN